MAPVLGVLCYWDVHVLGECRGASQTLWHVLLSCLCSGFQNCMHSDQTHIGLKHAIYKSHAWAMRIAQQSTVYCAFGLLMQRWSPVCDPLREGAAIPPTSHNDCLSFQNSNIKRCKISLLLKTATKSSSVCLNIVEHVCSWTVPKMTLFLF